MFYVAPTRLKFSQKLALDLCVGSPLGVIMIVNEEERAELPRELFALACRRLEYAIDAALEGQGRDLPREQISELSTRLHDVGRDLLVIADAIAVIACDANATP